MNSIVNFFHTHPAAFSMMTAAVTHFAHLAWDKARVIYPMLKSEGGLKGIGSNIWSGSKQQTQTEKQNEK